MILASRKIYLCFSCFFLLRKVLVRIEYKRPINYTANFCIIDLTINFTIFLHSVWLTFLKATFLNIPLLTGSHLTYFSFCTYLSLFCPCISPDLSLELICIIVIIEAISYTFKWPLRVKTHFSFSILIIIQYAFYFTWRKHLNIFCKQIFFGNS